MHLASSLRTINPVGPLPLIQGRRCPARSVASHLTSSVSDHQIVLLQCSHTASESGEGAGRCKRTFRTHRGAKASVSGPASRVASGIYTAQGRKKSQNRIMWSNASRKSLQEMISKKSKKNSAKSATVSNRTTPTPSAAAVIRAVRRSVRT